MSEIRQYISFDPGLNMRTHYLTEQMAYFLGGIYASEEQVTSSDGNYKIAPVRYNFKTATELEIAQHYELVKENAKLVNGQTYMAENIRHTILDSKKNRMPGFSTFFKSIDSNSLVDLIPSLRCALQKSPQSVQKAFLVGVFDGRSSADINKKTNKVRMIVLDCISEEVASFLAEMIEIAGIRYNYNTHRDRVEGGKPRNPQLRIKDVEKFVNEIGLISPRRIKLLKEAFEYNYTRVEVIEDNKTLHGLKTIKLYI